MKLQPKICWVIFGNPDNRRVAWFEQSLRKFEQNSILVVSYAEVLGAKFFLSDFLERKLKNLKGTIVIRFDSPGENVELEKQLILLSQQSRPFDNNERLSSRTSHRHGQILENDYWFFGYSELLQQVESHLLQYAKSCDKKIHFMTPAGDAICLFDKLQSKLKLVNHGVKTAPVLESATNFESLVAVMRELRIFRVFIKLRYSSSASGLAAFQFNPKKNQFRLITSVEMDSQSGKDLFFNSLKVRTYLKQEEIKTIVDFLFQHQVVVEEWIPKASQAGESYDLRVLTIDGRVGFTVVRKSKGPITNLHLGNKRCSLGELNLSDKIHDSLFLTANSAAAAFPDTTTVGWDILLTARNKIPYVIEGNAFGDLLPNLTNFVGNTYDNQVAAWLNKQNNVTHI